MKTKLCLFQAAFPQDTPLQTEHSQDAGCGKIFLANVRIAAHQT
jgi:hypothetical protein